MNILVFFCKDLVPTPTFGNFLNYANFQPAKAIGIRSGTFSQLCQGHRIKNPNSPNTKKKAKSKYPSFFLAKVVIAKLLE